MSAIHLVQASRHPAVLDVKAGELSIHATPPGAVKLSLVIPTYNESRNLEELVTRLATILDRILPGAYELIVVDDDSPDETWALALRLADRFPALRVMRRRGEKGLSTAVIRGWQAARGEVLAVIDADLQHPPEIVEKLWSEMATGADLAVGSRHAGGGGVSDWSALRRSLSRGAQLLGLCVLPGVVGRVSNPMSGYFMVRRSAIASAVLSPLGYKKSSSRCSDGDGSAASPRSAMSSASGSPERARSLPGSTSSTCATCCGFASRSCRRASRDSPPSGFPEWPST